MTSPTSVVAAEGERKFGVIMFGDLTGYTELCRRLDPEDVAATVRPVMAAMKAAVEAEGGVVPSVAGDGFMAVFGVPTASADAHERALRTSGAIRTLVAEANARAGGVRIPDVHIGIAAGEVLVSPSDEPLGWSLIGNAVNLASRLCSAAGPGEVLVDSALHRLLGPEIGATTRRVVAVSGVSDALEVWALPPTVPIAERVARPVAFVNRTETLQRLSSALEQCATDVTSRVLLIGGEAGIGKSRLLRHWVESTGVRHCWAWTGRGEGTALRSFAEEVATFATSDSVVEPLAQLEALSEAPAAPLRSDPFPAAAAAARDVVEAAARETPIVIVIDDLHAADPSLAALLNDIRERPLSCAALLLAAWRTDEMEPAGTLDIELEPLSPDDTVLLLGNALGAPAPAEVLSDIISRVSGRPLMTVQTALYLLETGAVHVSNEGCELRRPDALGTMPTSVRLFVAARLDRLPASEKSAVQELSTFGETVDRAMVEKLCGRHVLESTDALVSRGLLRASPDGWRFSHGLVQQVAYSSLPRSVRAELHRRQWQMFPEAHTGARLHHAQAWLDCLTSVDQEQRQVATEAALDAAIRHAEVLAATQAAATHTMLRAAAGLIEDSRFSFPNEVAVLYTLWSRTLTELGRYEDALEAAGTACELIADLPAARPQFIWALLARGHAQSRLRRFQAARQTLDAALSAAESEGDRTAEGHALRLLGDTWRHSSFADFIALTERAYDVLAEAGDRQGAAECACILAYLRSVSAPSLFARWRGIAQAAVNDHDLRGQLWLARADLEASTIRHDHRRSLQAADTALSLGRALDAADGVADGLAGRIRALTGTGELPDAIAAFEELRRFAITTGNPRVRLVAAAEGLVPLLRDGQLSAALDEYALAKSAVEGFGPSEVGTLALAASVFERDRGQWREATGHIRRLADVWAELGGGSESLPARVSEVIVHAEMGGAPSPAYVEQLVQECQDADAPELAGMLSAVARRLSLLNDAEGPKVELSIEVRAMWADTVALSLEPDSASAITAWRDATELWHSLGNTVWLARAQARTGDVAGAEATLRTIGADDAARDWAFSGGPGSPSSAG